MSIVVSVLILLRCSRALKKRRTAGMVGIDLATGKVEWCFQDLFRGCVSGCQVQQEGSDWSVICSSMDLFVVVVDNDVSGEWYLCVFDSLCQ